MGQFQDMLDKINQVEAQGFDPYTESYSARIGKLETSPTAIDPTATTSPKTYTAEDISKSFTEGGLDDPFVNMIDETGGVNLSTFSTAFDQAKNLGISPQAYLDVAQNSFPEAFEKTYSGYKAITTEGGGIGFEKKEQPVQKSTKYRFEQGERQGNDREDGKFKKGDPVYMRFDESTGEHITYDTKEAYDEARENYKKLTGVDIKDDK